MGKDSFIEITEEDYEDLYFETSLSKSLNKILEEARSGKLNCTLLVPVVGVTGSGKTSIIKEWLRHYKLKNWYISAARPLSKIEVEYFQDMPANQSVRVVSNDEMMNFLTPKKKVVNVLFSSDEIDEVDDQTIIVVDDYDRATEEVRNELFNLVRRNQVIDVRADNENKIKVLKPLMLIVVIDSLNTKVLNETELKLFGINK
jgi:Cdc6-like AAA superfamily ATPase